jgi:hypothetical protein
VEFLRDLFAQPPCPPALRQTVDKLIEDLIQIGRTDDFLSERPGSPFNMQCRHTRAREIGKRLFEIGGLDLMLFARRQVRRKLKQNLASHLDYAWTDVGDWES